MSINVTNFSNTSYFESDPNKTLLTISDSTHNQDQHIVLTKDLYHSSSLSKLISSPYIPSDTGILPPGVLYLKDNFLVFERPPTYQNIFIVYRRLEDSDYDEQETECFRILVPWQLYMVHFDDRFYTNSVRMHFMNSPLQFLDQQVFMAPLCNLYSSGNLCRPFFESIDDIERYPSNYSGVVQSAYDWVWNSGTNLDLTESVFQYYKQIYANEDFNSFVPKISTFELNTISQNFTSNYCSKDLVRFLYRFWESNINHDNISTFQWPSNSKKYSFIADYSEVRLNRYQEYLHQNPPQDYSTECCEDCVQYDEDEDIYYSHDECSCECHNPFNSQPISDFYIWAGCDKPSYYTFQESYNNFVQSFYSDTSFSYNLQNLEDYFSYLST